MMWRKILAVLAVLSLVGCNPTGPTPDPVQPRKTPAVAPDPNPVGSAGRNASSVLMFVGWEHEYTKIIDYQNGTLDADGDLVHTFEQRAQTPKGGEVFIASPFKPKTLYEISADPKRDRENRGITFCWILWNNVKVDSDYGSNGSIACSWLSP